MVPERDHRPLHVGEVGGLVASAGLDIHILKWDSQQHAAKGRNHNLDIREVDCFVAVHIPEGLALIRHVVVEPATSGSPPFGCRLPAARVSETLRTWCAGQPLDKARLWRTIR